MKKSYKTTAEEETRALAQEIFNNTIQPESNPQKALVLALQGELGAGKTTFTQALAKALGIKKRILSPTFLVMKRFPLPQNIDFENLYHIDAYRVGVKDLKALDIEEILGKPNIVVVEWADRVKSILPKDTLWVRFRHGKTEGEREITLNRR